MSFSLKNQGSPGFMKRALGVGLVAHGLAGATLYEAPKIADRVERYQERRNVIERHEAYQALRRRIVREALQEIREGHYRSGHFLIQASAIDLREAGFFPESTSVEAIEQEYDRLLTRFRAALQSNRGLRTEEQIFAALAQATEGYNYQGVHGTQLVLLLAEKIGSCDQISQLVMSLLHDSADVLGDQVQEVGMRVYPPGPNGSGHVAPVARFGGQELDFTAGNVAFPYGMRIAVNRMPQLYAERHRLSAGPPSSNRIRTRAWRESEEGLDGLTDAGPANGAESNRQGILSIESFSMPSVEGQDLRPFPGRVPFFGRSIVRQSGPQGPRTASRQRVGTANQSDSAESRESERWSDLYGMVRAFYESQLPQQLFIGSDAERRWLQRRDAADVSIYQPLSQNEMVLLSTLLEDFAAYDADYRTQRASGNPTLPNELANVVNAAALYRLLAVQSQVMGRRQAEAVAYERLGELHERIKTLLQESVRNSRAESEDDLLFVLGYFEVIGMGTLPLLDTIDEEARLALMSTVIQRIAQAAAGATDERDRDYYYEQSRLLAPFLLSGTADFRERILDRWQTELRPIQLSHVVHAVYQRISTVLNVRDIDIGRRRAYGDNASFRSIEIIGQHPLVRRIQNLQAFGNFQRSFTVGAGQDYSVLRRRLDDFARFANLSSDEARLLKMDVCAPLVSLVANNTTFIGNQAPDERLLLDMLADPAFSDPNYRPMLTSALNEIRRRQRGS